MKLVHPDLEMQFLFEKINAFQWVIESPELFVRYVQELSQQVDGMEGNFVCSDREQELSLGKMALLFFQPLVIPLQEKKLLNKLYHALQQVAYGETLYLETQVLRTSIEKYLALLEHESAYALESKMEFDFFAFLKAMGVQFAEDGGTFLERLVQYFKLSAELLGTRLVVLVQCSSYFTQAQMQQLLEFAAYQEIALLFVEQQQKDFPKSVPLYIIDTDFCEIF